MTKGIGKKIVALFVLVALSFVFAQSPTDVGRDIGATLMRDGAEPVPCPSAVAELARETMCFFTTDNPTSTMSTLDRVETFAVAVTGWEMSDGVFSKIWLIPETYGNSTMGAGVGTNGFVVIAVDY